MLALLVAAALAGAVPAAATSVPGDGVHKRATALPRIAPAPLHLYRVAWQRKLVKPEMLEWRPIEAGGPAVDPATGLVVVGTRDGWLHAIRHDGSLAWEKQLGTPPGPPAIAGETVYVGTGGGTLYALSARDGGERWRYEAKEELGTRPLVANGTLYVASLEDTVFAVDAATGAWKWHHRREGRSGFTVRGAATVASRDGLVFAAYSDGFAAGLDVATGAPRWERQVAPAGQYLDVDSIRLDGGRLYAAAYSGAVIALDAASGREEWSSEAKDAHRLALAPGVIVVVTTRALVGLSPVNGTALWTAPFEGAPAGEPAMLGRWLAVPANRGGLRWVETATGRTLRVLDPGTGVSATPAIQGERAYVLSNAGDLLALDLP